jgi:hypothetical protein
LQDPVVNSERRQLKSEEQMVGKQSRKIELAKRWSMSSWRSMWFDIRNDFNFHTASVFEVHRYPN